MFYIQQWHLVWVYGMLNKLNQIEGGEYKKLQDAHSAIFSSILLFHLPLRY
jgi:hypothetical protein